MAARMISVLSAGVCEELGFRGYMQRPIKKRHGSVVAILISSLFFLLLHLNKSWSLMAMTPTVFGAGVVLGALAFRAALIICIIGHAAMSPINIANT